jgi:precorrin-4 methylase
MRTKARVRPAVFCFMLALALILTSALPCLAAGSFRLVGLGPGDFDLMTPRQLKAIQEADLVFCGKEAKAMLEPKVDLGSKKVIQGYSYIFPFYGKDCAKVPADKNKRWGKTCEEYAQKRAEFLDMIRKAVAGNKKVVMASYGDPTIYGPAIWVMEELKNLDAKVVPGISSFNAANAALKAPLGEIIITAPLSGKHDKDTIESLAGHGNATMVIFMPRDFKKLMPRLAKAYAPDTPMAVVSNAGKAGKERVIMGTVGDIAPKLKQADPWLSLVYVGNALKNAPAVAAKPKADGRGKFYLVGIGPGDPDLASLRALEVIKKADLIIVHRRIQKRFAKQLQGKKVLNGYGRLFPFYGKACPKKENTYTKRVADMKCEDYHRKQAEFAAITRKAVAQGKIVAMLDDGDTMVYGPCSWTVRELSDINTEVVPGLSCFNAANAALGKSVTGGGATHSVLLASGWTVAEMAPHKSSMALFTMRNKLKKFVDTLLKSYGPETPVAIVFHAGYSQKERVMHGTLGNIMSKVQGRKLPFQHLLYVGEFLTNGKPY